jgi:hypothetical protein
MRRAWQYPAMPGGEAVGEVIAEVDEEGQVVSY